MTDTSSEAGHSPKLVVTLFESYGSGASYVSARVAEALGVPLHVQAFSSEEIEAAMSMHESQGLLTRVFNAIGGSYASMAGGEPPNNLLVAQQEGDSYELVAANTRYVEEAAREGGVIMGRNGAFILADWPRALTSGWMVRSSSGSPAPRRRAELTGNGLPSASSSRTRSAPTCPSSSTAGIRERWIDTTWW
jgi:hypothetical protein